MSPAAATGAITEARIARAHGALLSRTNWQMAPGERVALEGILASTKPRVAIELGTAQGGSLERIAAHSEEVHTFDFDPQVDESAFPNVTFHYGDIKVLLPELLAEFEREGRNVDFVLIDADHTPGGVRSDLEHVLRSGAIRDTYIVLHDTMNEAVSSGVEGVDLDSYPKVVFRDFGFVEIEPHPRWLRDIWGGLGLVICDERGRLDIPAERRERERTLGGAVHAGVWRLLAPARAIKRAARERLGLVRRALQGKRS